MTGDQITAIVLILARRRGMQGGRFRIDAKAVLPDELGFALESDFGLTQNSLELALAEQRVVAGGEGRRLDAKCVLLDGVTLFCESKNKIFK
jgi:hypothetical protein